MLGRFPTGIAPASNGDIYIADAANCMIRKLSGGALTTIAGAALAGAFLRPVPSCP